MFIFVKDVVEFFRGFLLLYDMKFSKSNILISMLISIIYKFFFKVFICTVLIV